ncbi:SDR family NAD(P)-dependent oxidoreductase [Paenibacillus tundrae]|uniref:Benzil reductase ((S)-benzoin forming) n=1 Tax=Paenibacillus tundrae TaxID=528187 RepID=A0ABT9WCX7_9BACL|nr:SDR family NAD(P)-dependent oxidoreductase [Paenibacillus tundrae]MDQ0170685.1 benzil reductase ((S)-benzoin forming) [Paenibacillus tundrae]
MRTEHYIITGTSKGIGMQLADVLLERGAWVHGISRGTPEPLTAHSQYTHYAYDLSDHTGIDELMTRILAQIPAQETEIIGLINNAAMVEPLKPIDQCNAAEISQSLNISLVAPMILSSAFIRHSNAMNVRRKIVNVSSASGQYPAPAMGTYCTAKAGINMFTQCLEAEQGGAENPVDVLTFDPGMVDTELQAVARGKNEAEFALSTLFSQAYEAGQLQDARDVAERLLAQLK